tara:strand:+ start:405 stop:758 length:354 start_codon:yes stop_codon:yes gene_type:complete
MAKKIVCIVTGRSLTIADSYFKKKVDKAGSEENLHKSYICKEAKKLLRLGNSVKKVREILDITDFNSAVDDEIIYELVFGNKNKKLNIVTDFTSLTSITHNQTDPEVKTFINKLLSK